VLNKYSILSSKLRRTLRACGLSRDPESNLFIRLSLFCPCSEQIELRQSAARLWALSFHAAPARPMHTDIPCTWRNLLATVSKCSARNEYALTALEAMFDTACLLKSFGFTARSGQT